MAKEITTPTNGEELDQKIEQLTDELLKGYSSKKHPKNINISGDASTTADQAVSQVKKAANDDSRGAGRPKQISDVPDKDQDGKREGKYDATITENEDKEDEPDETKQSPSLDQVNEKGHKKVNAKAPDMRPFKKADEKELDELKKSFALFQKFQEFETKAEEKITIPLAEYEELIKAKTKEKEETLSKGEIGTTQNEELVKSLSALTAKFDEQSVLLNKIAKTPTAAKSITNINALEKSIGEEAQETTFTKSEVADALDELVKANKLPDTAALEYDFMGSLHNPKYRAIVEAHLRNK